MGRGSMDYSLLLGVRLKLERIIAETNPDWKGPKKRTKKISESQTLPAWIKSNITFDEYERMTYDQRVESKEGYFEGKRKIILAHILPDGSFAESHIENKIWGSRYDHGPLTQLCFFDNTPGEDYIDGRWVQIEEQFLGIVLLECSSFRDEALMPSNETRLKKGLQMKSKIPAMINQYGFNFKISDIELQDYMNRKE